MYFQLISYLKFLIRSKNQHGVHSPFVYDLVTKCFYDRTAYSDYAKLKAYRTSLLTNDTTLTITDFGSGSKVFSSNERRIQAIAKTSATGLKRAQLLYRLVTYFKIQNALELGTSLGMGSYAMAVSHPLTNITSIEGCPEISRFTEQQLKEFHIGSVRLKTGAFSKVLPTLDLTPWDLVFFDGHHDQAATLAYFNQLLPTVHNDTVFIFDDIHWSKGMEAAWETIKNHPQTRVSIDTFFWGFVFFRTEQAVEHFIIRV